MTAPTTTAAERHPMAAAAATGTPPPMIRAEGLGRRFGDLWAIRGVEFELQRGEVFGLLGPNGAGKTTTVRLLTALIAPTEGRAWVDGFDVVEQADEVRARIGLLTETPALYERLSAVQNLDFFGRIHRLAAGVRAERIEHLLRLFDLWDRRDAPTGTFSKGMKQKLAIARAMLHEPAVLFFDEPTAALDPEAAFTVRGALETLRGMGRTIVLCTHNLDEAERLCDRVAFIRGEVLRVDSPARLRAGGDRPTVRIELADAAGADRDRGPAPAIGRGRRPRGPARRSTSRLEDVRAGHARSRSRARARGRPRGLRPRDDGDPGVGLLRRHGRRAGARAGRLMRGGVVGAILRREFRRDPPQPAARALDRRAAAHPHGRPGADRDARGGQPTSRSRPASCNELVNSHPAWAHLTPDEVLIAFILQQFLVTFLIIPGYIPLSIATFSIVGEKQSRSLEAVLATPIRTTELLAGKTVASLVPGLIATWLAYGVMVALLWIFAGARIAAIVLEPTWLAAVFALGPAVGLVSVVAGVIVSSRVNDPRTAQQIGGVVLIPIISLVVIQAVGRVVLDAQVYLLLALVTGAVGVAGLRIGTAVFDREQILTRWK